MTSLTHDSFNSVYFAWNVFMPQQNQKLQSFNIRIESVSWQIRIEIANNKTTS